MTSKATLERDLARAMQQMTRATRLAETIHAESSRADMMLAASTLAESLEALTEHRDQIATRINATRRHRGSNDAYARSARLGITT